MSAASLPGWRKGFRGSQEPKGQFVETYEIAVVQGDGIGPEVCQAAIDVLKAAVPPGVLRYVEYQAGAEEYRRSGDAYPEAAFQGCKAAHAILHGAGGLPGVTYPDGVEAGADFGLKTRFRLDLYANIRPIRLYAGVQSRLRDRKASEIDYVIVRENTEGLYAGRGGGVSLREELVADTLIVTRKGVERVCHVAFELARKRNGAPRDGKRRVTCCDKSNILRTYAFFRKVFDEVAAGYPDVEADYALVDAMTVHLIERPDFYDVIVAENMFGDIISDLAAATVGGMGMSPSGELGEAHGLFQAAHGSAPTIAGKGIANPYGSILSAASMLNWLGERYHDERLPHAARMIEIAVQSALADSGKYLTPDLGGSAKTRTVVDGVIRHLN
jgi:3-isopropylmalate dehydrogenase